MCKLPESTPTSPKSRGGRWQLEKAVFCPQLLDICSDRCHACGDARKLSSAGGSDLFPVGCPSLIHVEVMAEVNKAFTRIDASRGAEDDLEDLSGRRAEMHGRVPVAYIKSDANVAPIEGAKRDCVEHLLIGVVERVVKWPVYDVGRTSTSKRIYNAFRNDQELAENQ